MPRSYAYKTTLLLDLFIFFFKSFFILQTSFPQRFCQDQYLTPGQGVLPQTLTVQYVVNALTEIVKRDYLVKGQHFVRYFDVELLLQAYDKRDKLNRILNKILQIKVFFYRIDHDACFQQGFVNRLFYFL